MDTIPDCWLHGEGVNHFLGWFGCDIMEVTNDYDMMITGTSKYTGSALTEHDSSIITPLIQIKPNPFLNTINIILPDECLGKSIEIDIYNACGREVMSYVVERHEQLHIVVDTHDLSQGVYFICVTSDETQAVHKVVKVR